MLKYGELEDVLKNYCEIGMYEPKSGNSSEITVINLFFTEEDAATELKKFIEYIPIDMIDVVIDTSIGLEGNFKVFIELENNKETFENVCKILRDVSNLGNISLWSIKLYKREARNIKTKDLENFLNSLNNKEK